MDISLTPTEDVEVFFEMTDLHACINTETGVVYFDFSDFPIDHPQIKDNAENIGLFLTRYKKYMTIYDFVLYCMVHEPLHHIVGKLKPGIDYCPVFDIQSIVDTHFLDDVIMEDLEIKLHNP
jgi:hypothetical protein